jgi:signal transduction histidine kinase
MVRLIRVRLALSYAGIALLVTISLGAVLLVRLHAYYAGMEQDYLFSNAKAISGMAAPMLINKYPLEVQNAQVNNLAFLSQTRVRILDPQEKVLADSGPWQTSKVGLGVVRAKMQFSINNKVESPPASVIVIQSRPGDVLSGPVELQSSLEVGAAGGATTRPAAPAPVPGMDASIPAIPGGAQGDMLFFTSAVPVSSGVYGMYLSKPLAGAEMRSDQKVLEPIVVAGGKPLGFVELSESPAYGREIVNSVASGLALAGGLAILLAVGAGWLISRRLTAPLLNLTQATQQMSSGDLSVRVAEAGRADEFGALGKSFNLMASRIEETVQTLRRFLSDAAHELQTPLTALRTNLELARSEANSPGTNHYLNLALEQIERLQSLIKDLLSLSRLESGNGHEIYQTVDLNEMVRQVSEPFAARAEQAGQAFELDLPSGAAPVTGSPEKLRGALANLLDNALKFTPAGGAVVIRLREEPGSYSLAISDTGIGIPAEEIGMLFNRFHRARNASAYPGSGLGLAIVRAIAQAHGGSIQAANNPQGGACFTLTLPRTFGFSKVD